MTKKIDLESWDEFEDKIEELRHNQRENSNLIPRLLFRGQANADWPLRTTLERAQKKRTGFDEYYRLIAVIQPEIETFTQNKWELPEYPKVSEQTQKYEFLHTYQELNTSIYGYMTHLRHHGFPSPFLDWTRSARIATYFAFANAADEGRVSIYVLSEARMHSGMSGKPQIRSFGPNVKTHRRHFLQQCEYTMCAVYEGGSWQFAEHDSAFEERSGTEEYPTNFAIHQFTLPGRVRIEILEMLEEYNLNAFSLFGSEESLMETLALRHIRFSDPFD